MLRFWGNCITIIIDKLPGRIVPAKGKVMNKFLIIVLFSFLIFSCASEIYSVDEAGDELGWEIVEIIGYESEHTVVISYFPEGEEISELSSYLQNLITISTSSAASEEAPGIKVVSRQFLDQIIEEQEFQISGLADPATQSELGRQLGADIIVTGTIKYLDEEEYFVVNGQVIEVETGVVKGGFSYEFWTEDF